MAPRAGRSLPAVSCIPTAACIREPRIGVAPWHWVAGTPSSLCLCDTEWAFAQLHSGRPGTRMALSDDDALLPLLLRLRVACGACGRSRYCRCCCCLVAIAVSPSLHQARRVNQTLMRLLQLSPSPAAACAAWFHISDRFERLGLEQRAFVAASQHLQPAPAYTFEANARSRWVLRHARPLHIAAPHAAAPLSRRRQHGRVPSPAAAATATTAHRGHGHASWRAAAVPVRYTRHGGPGCAGG